MQTDTSKLNNLLVVVVIVPLTSTGDCENFQIFSMYTFAAAAMKLQNAKRRKSEGGGWEVKLKIRQQNFVHRKVSSSNEPPHILAPHTPPTPTSSSSIPSLVERERGRERALEGKCK